MVDHEILKNLLSNHQIYHTTFQMDRFITYRNGTTHYGMFVQALRELFGRFESTRLMILDLMDIENDIKEIEQKMKRNVLTDYEKRRFEIDKLRKSINAEHLELRITHKIREFLVFYHQAIALNNELGELNEVKKEILEKKFWLEHLKKQAAIEFRTEGRIRANTYEIILSMNDVSKNELLKFINSPEILIEHAEKNIPELPDYEITKAEIESVRKYIECSL